MTEWGVLLATFALIVAAGGALRAWGVLTRRRALAALPDGATVVRGFTMRVMARGRHGLPGVPSGRTQRTTGDLGYTAERLIISSNRGPLLDVRVDGRRLTSVRSPGPGKLVIEGSTPGASGPVGQFRLELGLADAATHVEPLQRFAAPGEGPGFAATFEPPGAP